MENKSVDLVVVSYNYLKYLKDFIRSIKNCSDLPYNLTTVDNCSIDGSREFIKENNGFRSILPNQNLGYGKAANLGASGTNSPLILFLNADMLMVDSQYLSKMVSIFEQDQKIAVVGPKLVTPDGMVVGAGTVGVHKNNILKQRAFRCFNVPDSDDPNAIFNIQVDCVNVCGAAYMIRRSVFEELGGFDENYFMYYEEEDLSFRVLLAGYRVVYTPITKIIHYWHQTKYNSAYLEIVNHSKKYFEEKWQNFGVMG